MWPPRTHVTSSRTDRPCEFQRRVRAPWVSMFTGTRALTVSPPGTRAAGVPATPGNRGRELHSHQSRIQPPRPTVGKAGGGVAGLPLPQERGRRGVWRRPYLVSSAEPLPNALL